MPQLYLPTNMEVFRRRKGLSQIRVAKLLSKHQVQISHYENDLVSPGEEVQKDLAELLGLSPETLMQPFIPDGIVEWIYEHLNDPDTPAEMTAQEIRTALLETISAYHETGEKEGEVA